MEMVSLSLCPMLTSVIVPSQHCWNTFDILTSFILIENVFYNYYNYV